MRKVLSHGLIGALPGLAVTLIPFSLHQAGVITSDQSQIGFVGVPLLFFGVLIGTLSGASDTGHGGAVGVGVIAGFVVGLAVGVVVDAALVAAGTNVAGIWLFLAPATMIGGGLLALRWAERRSRTGRSGRGPDHRARPRHT